MVDQQDEMDEEEYENRISRTPNVIYPPRVPRRGSLQFRYPVEGVRPTTSSDPTVPLQPKTVPPLPEMRLPATVEGKTRVKENKKRDLKRKVAKRTTKEVGKKSRMSLQQMSRDMIRIRGEIETRERELRERKQIQWGLKIRKERVERLENLQSPLHNLYNSQISDSVERCVLCGQRQLKAACFDAAVQVDRGQDRRQVETAISTRNPLGLGVQTSEEQDENERRRLRNVELNAVHERVRRQEREHRGSPRIQTGNLVDLTSAPPPPKPRLGEEPMPVENEDLLGLSEGWNDKNKGPLNSE